jgi:hypothetical protein
MYFTEKKQFYAATKEISYEFYEKFQMISYYFNIWKSHFLWLCISILAISITVTNFISFTDPVNKGIIIGMLVIIGGISTIGIHTYNGSIKVGSNFYAYQIRKKIAQKIISYTPDIITGRFQIIEGLKKQITTLEAIILLPQIENYYKCHGIHTLGYTGYDLVVMWQKYKRPELIVDIKRKINDQETLIAEYEKQKYFCERLL